MCDDPNCAGSLFWQHHLANYYIFHAFLTMQQKTINATGSYFFSPCLTSDILSIHTLCCNVDLVQLVWLCTDL